MMDLAETLIDDVEDHRAPDLSGSEPTEADKARYWAEQEWLEVLPQVWQRVPTKPQGTE